MTDVKGLRDAAIPHLIDTWMERYIVMGGAHDPVGKLARDLLLTELTDAYLPASDAVVLDSSVITRVGSLEQAISNGVASLAARVAAMEARFALMDMAGEEVGDGGEGERSAVSGSFEAAPGEATGGSGMGWEAGTEVLASLHEAGGALRAVEERAEQPETAAGETVDVAPSSAADDLVVGHGPASDDDGQAGRGEGSEAGAESGLEAADAGSAVVELARQLPRLTRQEGKELREQHRGAHR